MDSESRDQKNYSHGYAHKGDECAHEHRKTTNQFRQDRQPSHQVRARNVKGVKNGSESHRPFEQLGVTVLHESVAHDEAQRYQSSSEKIDSVEHDRDTSL